MTNAPSFAPPAGGIGPVLHFRGIVGDRVRLAAFAVRPAGHAIPALETSGVPAPATTLLEQDGWRAVRYDFTVPMAPDASYRFDGTDYPVDTAYSGDLRIAYAACNGQEHGDRERPLADRDALWARMVGQHAKAPFHLLLHGGDQIYADEILQVHPATRDWAEHDRPSRRHTPDATTLEAARSALMSALFARYLELYDHRDFAWLSARVPALAMWDDHDICDGWGSLPERKLDAPIGRAVFETARRCFLLFQCAATDAEPSPLFWDESREGLGWQAALPDLRIVAPDLRSERRRRQVMGPKGWAGFDAAMEAADEPRILVMSSVPALGPRLSWVERLMVLTPRMQEYEDDLRDQWQSRAHREEWCRFLQRLIGTHDATDGGVTVLSGEIHLATRGFLDSRAGRLHQLVASGITHPPPPKAYARTLGALARLGEGPLPDHPITLRPLPGRAAVYTAQRNYLHLARRDGVWRAWWELEEDGPSETLAL